MATCPKCGTKAYKANNKMFRCKRCGELPNHHRRIDVDKKADECYNVFSNTNDGVQDVRSN